MIVAIYINILLLYVKITFFNILILYAALNEKLIVKYGLYK